MDVEKEINALSAETLALGFVVGNVLSTLAGNPSLRPAITEGLNQAANVAEHVAIKFGKSAPSEHTVKALRIVEEIRAMVLGNEYKPKNAV